MKKVYKSSRGAISTILIILAVAILLVSVIGYVVVRYAQSRNAQKQEETAQEEQGPPPKVYEYQLGSLKFFMDESLDLGNTLRAKASYQETITTTEKFVKVIVSAQNKGKVQTDSFMWDVGNLIDSEGRIFIPDIRAYYFLPQPDHCGAVLKPEFAPISCVKIYQVSRKSEGLKVEVVNKINNQRILLDLNFGG